MKHVIAIFFVLLYLGTFAQVPVEISNQKEIFNGKEYYIHEVKQGQTLYSISRAYQVTVDEILQVNTFARDGLKTGQFLRIPVKGQTTPQVNEKFIQTHRPQDTIFLVRFVTKEAYVFDTLLKMYSIHRDDFLTFNPKYQNVVIVHKKTTIWLPIRQKKIFIQHFLKENYEYVVVVPYRVQQGETLYTIARHFQTSVETLQTYNPELTTSIQIGQIIYVPVKSPVSWDITEMPVSVIDCHNPVLEKHYQIALLVPFFLDKARFISFDTDAQKNMLRQFQSFEFIQFYEGFLIATQNFAEISNVSFTVYVYDVFSVEKLNVLYSRGLLDVDLIIGPFHKNLLDHLISLVSSKQIPIISAYFPTEFTFECNYPHLLNLFTDPSIQIEELLHFICKTYPRSHIIFTYQSTRQHELMLIEHARSYASKITCPKIFFVPFDQKGVSGIISVLNSSETNILVNFSNDEVFVTNFLRILFDNIQNIPLIVYGLPSWLRFDNVELRYLNHFNAHFFSSVFVDYQSEAVREFIAKFQEQYNTDPERLAFIGYDIGKIAITGLSTYGSSFFNCLHMLNIPLLSLRLEFDDNLPYNYKQNRYVYIYEIVDYNLLDSRKLQR